MRAGLLVTRRSSFASVRLLMKVASLEKSAGKS